LEVGDLVARSYAWPELVSGIIIGQHEEQINTGPEAASAFSYLQITYTVAWADGSVSSELDRLYLEYFEEVLSRVGTQFGYRK